MNDLEIFKLGITLAQALNGEQEAIADLKYLFNKHPEMFKNLEDLREVIKETVLNPEIITNTNKEGGILGAKRISESKMGEVGIYNDNGTNEIFHANKKRISEFYKLEEKARLSVETPSAEAAPTWSDRCADEPNNSSRFNNELSTADSEIIPQQSKQKDKLIINIFGAPGVGKSTLAKKLQEFMSKYKPALVEEFATFLIKEGRENELENQTFVSSNQAKMLENGFKQSNLVISDSPIDLGIIYNNFNANKNDKESSDYIFEVHNIVSNANTKYESIDIFIKHDQESEKGYSMQDRVHTLQESKFLEEDISRYLLYYERKPIAVDRSCDIETLIDTIKENPKFKEFAKSNRFANLKKPSDTPNNDTPNNDKSKDTDGRTI